MIFLALEVSPGVGQDPSPNGLCFFKDNPLVTGFRILPGKCWVYLYFDFWQIFDTSGVFFLVKFAQSTCPYPNLPNKNPLKFQTMDDFDSFLFRDFFATRSPFHSCTASRPMPGWQGSDSSQKFQWKKLQFRKLKKLQNLSLRIKDYPQISGGWDWIPYFINTTLGKGLDS